MKRLVFILVLFCLFSSVGLGAEFAVDKGSNMFSVVGGFVNASGDLYKDSEGHSSNTFVIMPSVVHFSPANVGFGGDFLLLRFKQGDAGLTTLGLGPKLMFAIGKKESKAYPYATLAMYYIRNTEEQGSFDYTVSGTRLKFGAGVSFMVASHLGVLVEASYNLDNLKGEHAKESVSGDMVILSVGLAGFLF
ncbi:MAG: outer membrane beta-barrel protein [Candidatus Zixiibacteriota bacterium]